MEEEPVIINRQNVIDEIKHELHQTPRPLALRIINDIDFPINARVMDPFAGTGSFYDQFPEHVNRFKTEIRDGTCYSQFDYDGYCIDMVLTNPPFKLKNDDGITERNAFFEILLFFTTKPTIKQIIFLCSATCRDSITPLRMKKIEDNGFYLTKITMCCVSRWRGRYAVMYFMRQSAPNPSIGYYQEGY
jgi:hypothetical protein